MFKRLSEAISHITYFTTFLIVSITLGGLIFFDSFSKGIKYDNSIFDLDFYTLFIRVIVLDRSNFIGWGLILFIILFITFEFFPRAINFFLGVFYFIGLVLNKIFKKPLLFLIESSFMVLLSPLIVINWFLFDQLSEFFVRAFHLVVRGVRTFDNFSRKEQKIVKERYKMDDAYKDYERSNFWILFLLLALIIWLNWLTQFGKSAEEYILKLKNKESMTHNIFLISKDKIIRTPCIYVSKVKNGYMVMVKEGKINKPVIYSDNIIYKIENK